MQKIFSILLILIFLSQNVVFAVENTKPDLLIKCSTENPDEFCKSIEITKENIELKSYLKKKYSAFLYSINNNQENSIEIVKIEGAKKPSKKDVIDIQRDREWKRFTGGVIFPIVITLVAVPLVLVFSILEPKSLLKFHLRDLKDLGSAFNFVCIKPVKITALTPYYLIADPRSDKKAYKEAELFKDNIDTKTLNQNEKAQFAVLLPSYSKGKLSIQLKNIKTGKLYIIEK